MRNRLILQILALIGTVLAQDNLITISDNFLIYTEKTLSVQKRGKLNPKFLLSLNQTITTTNNGNKTTTYKNWYLTVAQDIHGAPIGLHLSDNATEADFWAWGESIPQTSDWMTPVIGWFGHDEEAGDPTKMDTEWFLGIKRDQTAPYKIDENVIEVNKLWKRYDDSFLGRSHQYWHIDEDGRVLSRATGDVIAATDFNNTAGLEMKRKVDNNDKYASRQHWAVYLNSTPSDEVTWENSTWNEHQIMLMSDGFGRVKRWDLNHFNDDAHAELVYHYWVRSRYEYFANSDGFDLQADACNTEIIRYDDEHFGLVDRAPDPYHHRSNWTTHNGADHFLYGEKYDSEKVGDVTLRGGIPAEKWQASSENFTLTHYFPHGNWSWQFNETNGQAPMLVEAEANFTYHHIDYNVKLSWHILYMLNQFDRHQLDAVPGDDPFDEDMTPKWADCDKSVTQFDDQRPDSLKGKNVDTLTESVDLLTGNVYGAHTRFDIDTNITRVDYYDPERGANIRRIEMKQTKTLYEINKDTRSCQISELRDSFDFFKNRDVEPDQLFALPDAAVYNEPRDLRQNIYSDTWLETYDTVLDYGPYKGQNATCSGIYHYPGIWHSDQENSYTNAESGMLLGYERLCLNTSTGEYTDRFSINNFGNQDKNYDEFDFDTTPCWSASGSDSIYDFYFTMTGPYSKLTPQQGYEFPSSVMVQIEVLTGLMLQTRIQHMHVDLYTDFELENPEIMVRFSLLPYQSFNDEEDLTNEEFLERIAPTIDGEMIAVQFYPENSGESLNFHSVSDSLAISYDGGIVYEPMSNKTVIKVVIEHEKGYSTGGMVFMALIGLFGMAGIIIGLTWFRFKRSSASSYDTLE